MAAHLTHEDSDKHHLVLTYLDIKGYAEPIRISLAIGQVIDVALLFGQRQIFTATP
jgi:hypothetical protein